MVFFYDFDGVQILQITVLYDIELILQLFSDIFSKRKLSRNPFLTYPYFIYLIILRVARTASTIGFHGVDFLVDCGARAHALTYSAYERAHMDSLSL